MILSTKRVKTQRPRWSEKKISTYTTKYINTLLIYPKKSKRYPEAKNKQQKKIKFPGALRHPSKRQTQSKNKTRVTAQNFYLQNF